MKSQCAADTVELIHSRFAFMAKYPTNPLDAQPPTDANPFFYLPDDDDDDNDEVVVRREAAVQYRMGLSCMGGSRHKRPQVPLWGVGEVLRWVSDNGFADFASRFERSSVDGDLLLQLDDEHLVKDLHMENGLVRKRFWRELDKLKRITDYSSCDHQGVADFLQHHPLLGPKFLVYAYPLIQADFCPTFIRNLSQSSVQDTLKEYGVSSLIHQAKILSALFEDVVGHDHVDPYHDQDLEPDDWSPEHNPGFDKYDVFVCNANPGCHGSNELSSLITVNLRKRGYSVFLEDHHSPSSVANRLCDNDECALSCNASLIKNSTHFLLVLTPGSLDEFCCISPTHKMFRTQLWTDIVTALESKECNVIPVLDAHFHFPQPDLLPEQLRALCYFSSVRWIHEYQDACIGKLDKFMMMTGRSVGHSMSGLHSASLPSLLNETASLKALCRMDSGLSSLSLHSP